MCQAIPLRDAKLAHEVIQNDIAMACSARKWGRARGVHAQLQHGPTFRHAIDSLLENLPEKLWNVRGAVVFQNQKVVLVGRQTCFQCQCMRHTAPCHAPGFHQAHGVAFPEMKVPDASLLGCRVCPAQPKMTFVVDCPQSAGAFVSGRVH